MKPLGFAEPKSPADMAVEVMEKDRRRDGLVATRRMGRGSTDCMVREMWVMSISDETALVSPTKLEAILDGIGRN